MSVHREHQISGGLVASLDSVFYNDPLEGDRFLYEQLAGTPYRLAVTINPLLPCFEQDWMMAKTQWNAAAVRVYPAYHGYDFDHPAFVRLCERLRADGVPLLVCLRLEDARLEYLIRQHMPSLALLADLARRMPDLKLVVLHISGAELGQIGRETWENTGLCFDTSGLKNDLFAMEKIVSEYGAEKLVFGSQWPLNCFASTFLKVQDLDCPQKEQIFTRADQWLAQA